jgi:hypothetical protein
MAYATYSDYTNTFKGNVIPSSDFDRAILRATEYIDLITQNKAATSTYTAKLTLASCAVAEMLYQYGDSFGKRSESVSGQSVTYDETAIKQMKYNACRAYLWDTGLLYSGVF